MTGAAEPILRSSLRVSTDDNDNDNHDDDDDNDDRDRIRHLQNELRRFLCSAYMGIYICAGTSEICVHVDHIWSESRTFVHLSAVSSLHAFVRLFRIADLCGCATTLLANRHRESPLLRWLVCGSRESKRARISHRTHQTIVCVCECVFVHHSGEPTVTQTAH